MSAPQVATGRTRPSVVTFDFWNTLVRDEASTRDVRIDAWMGLLEGEAAALEREHVGAAYAAAWGTFQEHWRANRPFGAPEAVREVLGRLGLAPPPELVDALVAVITDPDPRVRPAPTPNIGPCLERLRSAGTRIGIICDVGLTPSRTLRGYLEGHGLLGYFDHWSFSDEVGTFKPDPRIFEHALAGLGASDPAAAAHVGDLRRTDVAGAQAMGMVAVRYTGVFDDPGDPDEGTDVIEGDLVVADHADLPEALGV
ncbi:MAG: HAD-superfamily hydrolase, subfamily variant 1 [Acidimicrobiales bacterium]|nr:HAD-superfamily hydrolase, subfamily variant 1 [Acidimicrobiales bacterium]